MVCLENVNLVLLALPNVCKLTQERSVLVNWAPDADLPLCVTNLGFGTGILGTYLLLSASF